MRWTPSQGAHAWSPGPQVWSCPLPNVSRTPTCCGGTAAQPADNASTSANPERRFMVTSLREWMLRLRFLPLRPHVRGEDPLPEADRGRGHLDQLVLVDELERLLERQLAEGDEPHCFVRAGCAHVRQLLFAGHVDVHIGVPRVLADAHSLVDARAGADE